MSARSITLGLAAAAACAALAAPLPAAAAPAGSTGMDLTGTGVPVDVCGGGACANLGAVGRASGRPFPSADFELAVFNTSGVRPQAGECVKVGVGLHLYQPRTTSMDSFHGEGQGKLCASASGSATVTGRYSGGGVVGDPWMWGSGQGSLTATFGTDGTVSLRATGTYSVSPLK